jgi:inner membrane protein
MDNLCHTLVGAALAEAGLKSRSRFGTATLVIASNLPDLDVLIFATGTPSVAFRRGWTHGILAQALLPLALTAVILRCHRVWSAHDRDRPPVRGAGLLLLCYAGVLSHVALDWVNNYGVRLLMPFSYRWFYGDAVFIIDPWMWITLGAGIFLARRFGRRTPARVALTLTAIYVILMVSSALAARQIVFRNWVNERGAAPRTLMVGPAPIDPLHRRVIVDAGDHYEMGTFSWWSRDVQFDAEALPRRDDDPAVLRARGHPTIRGILTWARFPYYDVSRVPGGSRVTVRDLRFGTRIGTAAVLVPE